MSKRKDISRVFSQGRKIVGRGAIVWFLETASPEPPRLGLSVSSKVGIAVRRNRLKRLAREAFRLSAGGLRQGVHVVVYFRRGCRWEGLADAQEELRELWRKAGVLKES